MVWATKIECVSRVVSVNGRVSWSGLAWLSVPAVLMLSWWQWYMYGFSRCTGWDPMDAAHTRTGGMYIIA